jgi:hypothetical protein
MPTGAGATVDNVDAVYESPMCGIAVTSKEFGNE